MRHFPQRRKSPRDQSGFTLLELLVVIAVLGILAGVTVFSIGALKDDAQTGACDIAAATLETAMDAQLAMTGVYVDEASLVSAGLLRSESESYDIKLTGDGYEIVAVGDCVDGGGEEIADGATTTTIDPADADPASSDDPDKADPDKDDKDDDDKDDDGKDDDDKGDDKDDEQKECGEDDRMDLNKDGAGNMAKAFGISSKSASRIIKDRPYASVSELERVKMLTPEEVEHILSNDLACV